VNTSVDSVGILRELETKFRQEAKIIAAVCSHPNVVTSYGMWLEEGKAENSVIVMGNFLDVTGSSTLCPFASHPPLAPSFRFFFSMLTCISEYTEMDLKKFCQFLHASFIDLEPPLALSIFLGIAQGLHFLHLQNYVHRDICLGKEGEGGRGEEGGGRREEGGRRGERDKGRR
jgi:serine/threonine protein kinase